MPVVYRSHSDACNTVKGSKVLPPHSEEDATSQLRALKSLICTCDGEPVDLSCLAFENSQVRNETKQKSTLQRSQPPKLILSRRVVRIDDRGRLIWPRFPKLNCSHQNGVLEPLCHHISLLPVHGCLDSSLFETTS